MHFYVYVMLHAVIAYIFALNSNLTQTSYFSSTVSSFDGTIKLGNTVNGIKLGNNIIKLTNTVNGIKTNQGNQNATVHMFFAALHSCFQIWDVRFIVVRNFMRTNEMWKWDLQHNAGKHTLNKSADPKNWLSPLTNICWHLYQDKHLFTLSMCLRSSNLKSTAVGCMSGCSVYIYSVKTFPYLNVWCLHRKTRSHSNILVR